MKRDTIDFHQVPERQVAMHERLENWGRSCWSGSGAACSPMFRLYRSEEVWHALEPRMSVDQQDAAKISKGVKALPEPHMRALQWCYVTGGSPMRARMVIGCTAEGLAMYVVDARTMLINRRI
jgi:hypothetical protein